MQNNSEKGIKSDTDVIPAVARFLGQYSLEDFTTKTPEILQEMFNDLMRSEYADDREYRKRLLLILSLSQDFSHALALFTNNQFQVVKPY